MWNLNRDPDATSVPREGTQTFSVIGLSYATWTANSGDKEGIIMRVVIDSGPDAGEQMTMKLPFIGSQYGHNILGAIIKASDQEAEVLVAKKWESNKEMFEDIIATVPTEPLLRFETEIKYSYNLRRADASGKEYSLKYTSDPEEYNEWDGPKRIYANLPIPFMLNPKQSYSETYRKASRPAEITPAFITNEQGDSSSVSSVTDDLPDDVPF